MYFGIYIPLKNYEFQMNNVEILSDYYEKKNIVQTVQIQEKLVTY